MITWVQILKNILYAFPREDVCRLYRPALLFMDQQHLDCCYKCEMVGPTPGLLSQPLHFYKILPFKKGFFRIV